MAKVRSKSRRLKRKSIRKTRRSRMSSMSRRGGSEDDLIVNEHEFYVYLLGPQRKDIKGKDVAEHVDKIKKWFENNAIDRDDEYYHVDVKHIKDDKFTASYKYYKDRLTPKEHFTQFLQQDQKYPISIGEKDYTVYASLEKD